MSPVLSIIIIFIIINVILSKVVISIVVVSTQEPVLVNHLRNCPYFSSYVRLGQTCQYLLEPNTVAY